MSTRVDRRRPKLRSLADLGGASWMHDAGRFVPAAVLMLGVAVQGALLFGFARHFWFVMDDWDFVLLRGTIPDENRGWMEPRNGHWSTLTIAVYRALFSVFGLRHYLPYAGVTITFHLCLAVLWFVVLVRARSRGIAALAGAWIILFMGVGGDAILYSAAMNHLGSLLLGLLAVAAWLWRRSIYITTLLLLGAVMFSNTGVSAVFFVVVFVAIHDGIRAAAKVVALPAVSYIAWYAAFGHGEANAQMPSTTWDYLKIPKLVWESMSASLGNALGFPEVGPAALLALVVGTFAVRTQKETLKHLAWAGVLAAVFLSAVLSLSRQFVSPETGRYSYYTMVFLVPAVALCVEGLTRLALEPKWLPIVIAATLLAGYAINGVLAERTFSESWTAVSRPWRDRVLGMVEAVDDGEKGLNEFSGDFYNADVNPARMSHKNIRAALPHDKATPQGRIDAEGLFMVRVGGQSIISPAGGGLDQIEGSFTQPVSSQAGCRTYQAKGARPALVLGTGKGNEITVKSQSTEVVTQLLRGEKLVSTQRTWQVQPGTAYISTTAHDALLFITFNGSGEYEICKA